MWNLRAGCGVSRTQASKGLRTLNPLPKLKSVPVLARGGEATVRTEFGEFKMIAYGDDAGHEHMAVLKGEVQGDDVLCRVHSECLTGEVFHSRRCECGPQLQLALERIEAAGRGVVVYLRQEGRGIGLINKIRAYALQDEGADTLEANQLLGFEGDLRRYDAAAEILRDLGVESVALMTNNPAKVAGLQNAGIPVLRRVAHHVGVHDDNRRYMETKRRKMGHDF